MKRWGIKNRVLILAIFPTVAIALVLGIVFTQTRLNNIDQLLIDRGQSISRQLATACEYGIFTRNITLLKSLSNSTLEERDVRTITVLDSKHNVILHTGPRNHLNIDRNNLPNRTILQKSNDSSSIFIAPVLMHSRLIDDLTEPLSERSNGLAPIGWVSVELSHSHAKVEKYQTLITSTLLISIGLLINVVIALRMSRDVTDPIVQITSAVTALKDGNLNTRVYTDAGQELKELESGINSMAQSLSRAYDEMQQNIDQATEDLRETLETIEIQNIELDIARKEALEASRIKSEFLANMSHEIRTPLNGILGFTNLLLKGHLSQQQKDHLSTIRKSSEILLTIINDILDFSKIEAGKLTLDQTPFKLRDIVDDVLTMLAPAAHQKNLDLVSLVYVDVPDDIIGDPLRVKQIITNLINNAIKFTQSGEVVLRAMIEEIDDNQVSIKISVTDTGVGLSRVQQQSLFHAFSQADASTARQYGGTGLGLVISKRLAEEMGGEIGLDSELGRGSSFWFTLVTEVAASPLPAPAYDAIRTEKVILLENHPTTRLAIKHMLDSWDVKVDEAESPTDLLNRVVEAQANQDGYAAALIGIPKHLLTSNQMTTLIRELEYNRDCRALVMTPTIDDMSLPLLKMTSVHLTKPVSRGKLYEKLKTLIHGDEIIEPEIAPYPAEADAEGKNSRIPTILAVDDNDANLKLVKALLEELQTNVHCASSGFEALSKVKQCQYDLIFMDVQMPGMDGIETTAKIRETERSKSKGTPIIALTAHALAEEKHKLLNTGFNDYLTKPISEPQLADVIFRRTGFRPTLSRQSGYNSERRQIRPSTKSTQGPSVDIDASIRLSAGKADLAEELFSMLLEHLIDDSNSIREHFEKNESEELLHRVHKLHGATRYCGVPELRHYSEILETKLKRHEDDLETHFQNLISAIERVQNWAENNPWQKMFREYGGKGKNNLGHSESESKAS
ncbi:MAG: two-component sensor histidine kinase BarA [Pseudomonadales bacterium]|nr:two-component sensor histidine kinase BarA [Pseudomonadales bacterium]